ncbi:adenosine deaminase [uncultured Microbacterium sp.]|jgi:adenosine deaminase|uniref:adenosine deaminase n=1 Tax=uncultured Microbacterium sp. TaxID=191216 RepID=UPI0026126712|nr:adenosine deaminase [uncultured Microbacterium sp.]
MAIDHNGDMKVQGLSLRALPKVSLHDHLDGAVRPETIIDLAGAAGIETPAKDAAGLRRWFAQQCGAGSLPAYLKTFELVAAVTQTEAALTRIAREYVADLAADGVIYGEVRWAPEQHTVGGLSPNRAVAAVQRGLEEGEEEAEAAGRSIRISQILSAMRQGDRSLEIARLAVANREHGVVAFDIAGPEDGFPASRHREAFDYLASEFLPVTVHAGEGAGSASIRSALIDGRALRLGHGVRIAEDLQVIEREGDDVQVQFGDLARWVRDREIPLELSPSSNLQTGAIAQWGDEAADHPFDLLYQLGFAVTVNTDNRTMSATTLTRELGLLVDAFEYDLDDLEVFQFNAASAAFLPVEEREELVEMIAEGFER